MFSFGRPKDEGDAELWQDREIRFDCDPKLLGMRAGEVLIDSINSVEDTKGNNGERGSLAITNLRMIWQSHKVARTNLSVGYGVIQNLTIRTTQSKLRGTAQALFIMTSFNGSRFEFIFTSLVKASPRLFTTVQAVFRAYETSKLYRDLKLRGAIIKEKQLLQLPNERVFRKVDGVWNLSSDQGNLGSFFITNLRVVWHASLAENFNVSVPYVQVKEVYCRESKFGRALVIETSERSGGYLLGFRIDPADALDSIAKEITALNAASAAAPNYGVEFTVEDKPESLDALKVIRASDDVEIVAGGDDGSSSDAFAAYFADASKEADRPVTFSADLGLAVETVPEGLSLEKLWAPL